MNLVSAVIAAALVAVPILALPTRSPAQADSGVAPQGAAVPGRDAAIIIVLHRGNERPGWIRIGL